MNAVSCYSKPPLLTESICYWTCWTWSRPCYLLILFLLSLLYCTVLYSVWRIGDYRTRLNLILILPDLSSGKSSVSSSQTGAVCMCVCVCVRYLP